MKTTLQLTGLVAGSLLVSSIAFADAVTLAGEHGHGTSVSGKITMLRVQEKGIEVMAGKEKVDAEVLVQIDAQPNLVLILPFHEQDPSKREMVETLRQAYLSDKPVTVNHMIAPEGKQTAPINWVQLGALQQPAQ